MVVRESDADRVSPDGFAKDLGDACGGGVDRASVERWLGEHVVFGVEDEQADFFLLQQLTLEGSATAEDGGDCRCIGGAAAVDLPEG